MSDWYIDITANLEYEKEMHACYSEWKLQSRIWQERAERMKALAASRLELLSILEWTIDVETGLRFCPRCGEWEENGHDDDCELAKELGDD